MKEKIKAGILPKLIKGLILVTITAPFTIGIVIKAFYGVVFTFQHTFNHNAVMPEINLTNKFFIFCYNISPDSNFLKALTWGNLLSLIIAVAFIVGAFWMRFAIDDYFRLQEAKRKAEDEDLKDEYRKNR